MSNEVSALCGSVALNLCYFPFLAMDPIWIWADGTTKSSALAMFWLKPIHSMWVTCCTKWGQPSCTTGTSSVTRLRADQRGLHKSSRPRLPGPALCFMRDISNIILTYLRTVWKKSCPNASPHASGIKLKSGGRAGPNLREEWLCPWWYLSWNASFIMKPDTLSAQVVQTFDMTKQRTNKLAPPQHSNELHLFRSDLQTA